ncbi:MAG: hypothetical protein HY776_00320 [Actinobacteria bacterium]|nr:hypothetical protein [Actinomycetota bacterium]
MYVPFEWKRTINDLIEAKGKVFLLGGSDTGKTTFAFILAKEAVSRGLRVGFVDADLGQTSIGPPCTIGSAVLSRENIFNDLIEPDKLYFVGDTSPYGHLLQSVVGTKQLVDETEKLNPDLLIIDTSGLIDGAMGQALKYHKIISLRPDFVIASQREDELYVILKVLSSYQKPVVKILPVPVEVKRLSSEMRAKNRKLKFESYFKDSTRIKLKINQISFYPSFQDVLKRREFENLIVGLKDENGSTKGIGVIDKLNNKDGCIEIFTPASINQIIKGIEFGFLKININGDEFGKVRLWKT